MVPLQCIRKRTRARTRSNGARLCNVTGRFSSCGMSRRLEDVIRDTVNDRETVGRRAREVRETDGYCVLIAEDSVSTDISTPYATVVAGITAAVVAALQ